MSATKKGMFTYAPALVATLLNQFKSQIIAVRGNCDSEVDQMLLEFPMMSDYLLVLLNSGTKMFITHGHLYNQDSLPPLNTGDILCHGHSHVPQADWQGGHFIFNPGSTTFPRGKLAASYGLYEDGIFSVYDLDGQEVLKEKY